MHVKRFFEKYQHNFECALSVRPKIKTTSPFFLKIHYHIWNYHPCRFEANMKTPPTFMKCGITILKILRKLPIVRPFN